MPLKGAITSHWSFERWCSISLLDDCRLRKMLGCDSVPFPFFQQTSILHEIILMINSITFKFGNLSRALLNQIINWKKKIVSFQKVPVLADWTFRMVPKDRNRDDTQRWYPSWLPSKFCSFLEWLLDFFYYKTQNEMFFNIHKNIEWSSLIGFYSLYTKRIEKWRWRHHIWRKVKYFSKTDLFKSLL